MYERILQQMRDCIRTKQYVMTIHAADEMYDNNFSIFDVESAVLTGEITERQKIRQLASGNTFSKVKHWMKKIFSLLERSAPSVNL